MPVIWVEKSVILALHEEHLAEHGGASGILDQSMLESALSQPKNKIAYQSTDIADLAAAYGYSIITNHPFFDGNKRTAFTTMELFLALNGQELLADDASCVITVLKLAEGSQPENECASWIRTNIKPAGS
ncbi:type II toxin-antitoxin system death-on-curing family toxin [Methylomonas paludis]|uniref:Type II toxin-antitoxin system death-on-curing family toxin n=1 Tax=Methylomonas paludis TaxID=1173101 RepID=A0A975MPT1_9GAMM|nr:type II toxin-antitoxin system death-on-curing family toxin [Methylomonas paludis]QWF71742.1 type II toxin-antitoxin system death-on-curing family toxin [Methylomonas paludis]